MTLKKYLCAFVVVCFAFCFLFPHKLSAELSVSAKACVLMDGDTGAVLYSKNKDTPLAMASTTKIMTALLCLENERLYEEFTVDEKAIRVEGSSMGLISGDRVNLKTLAIGMLLLSGNDSANAAAVFDAGSTQKFVEKMNLRAKEIGMKNTSFETPSGLDGEKHYSTAYDMSLLASFALKNENFVEICSKSKMTVTFGKDPMTRTFYNHNRLLKEVEGCIGLKTGFTKKAGRCLVSAVKRNGRTLVCVTLSAPNDWQDHKRLYNYGFSLYNNKIIDLKIQSGSIPVVNGSEECVTYRAIESIEVYVRENEQIEIKNLVRPFEYAPVFKNRVVGKAQVSVDGAVLECIPLISQNSSYALYEREEEKKNLFEKLKEWFFALF